MKAFLDAWLGRYMQGRAIAEVQSFDGKTDLLAQLERRLSGYRGLLRNQRHRVFVMIDLDEMNCRDLKKKLEEKCASLRLLTPRSGNSWNVATCIVIKELEAWYLGNWPAVRSAYPDVPRAIPRWKGYPDPDAVSGKTKDFLHRVLVEKSRCYRRKVPNIELARRIGDHFDERKCKSQSFKYFCGLVDDAIRDG